MAADVSSYSCSSLRSQEDPCPTRYPAHRSLKTSRRDEISEGFDSLSGLLSDLRSAQDDAQQEVARALKERDRLLSCLQSKERNDDRMNDFLSQLGVAESRCHTLTDQLDYMKKMYTSGGGGACHKPSPCGRRSVSRGRSPGRPCPCPTSKPCEVKRRRSLSNSLPTGHSPHRCGARANASSPSLRTSNPCTSRSPGRKPPCRGGLGGGVRLESLLPRGPGRRDRCDRGDDTDADGDHLWCDKRRQRSLSRSRCGGILANASKYVPGSVAELRQRSRAASLASRNTSMSPGRGGQRRSRGRGSGSRPPPRSRRAASESVSRRFGGDSGIDSDSESPTRLAAQHAVAQQRAAARARASMGRAPLPFLSSSNTAKSHHIGANIQNVMSLAKHTGACSRFRAPLPDIKVGRLPQRGPFLRFKRRKPFKYYDKVDIAKYKIEVDPRSCGPNNTADFALYRRDMTGCSDRGSLAPPRRCTRRTFNPAPSIQCADDCASSASATVQRMLGNPTTLRRTKRSLKQLLEELAEEFAGLECVCQRLETDMSCADGTVDRRELEEQISRLECMMEERRRQVCCLLKLYKQIKKLSRSSCQDPCSRPRRSILRGCRYPARAGRLMRVNTRIMPNSLRPRGVTFSMQKSFPLRPLQPRCAARRGRPATGPRVAAPIHGVELKVLQDMKNIQRRMRIDMGDEYY